MDYMPRDKARFDEWLDNFAAKVPAIAAALGLPPPMVTAVTDAYAMAPWASQYWRHLDSIALKSYINLEPQINTRSLRSVQADKHQCQ